MTKLTIITESWPTLGVDSIYLNKAFRELGSEVDICIYTTSKDGYSVVTGGNNILIHRVESVPHRASKRFYDNIYDQIKMNAPDVLYTISPTSDFFVKASKNIAHWPAGKNVDKNIAHNYSYHVTFDSQHKADLASIGVPGSNIFIMTPNDIYNTIKNIIS